MVKIFTRSKCGKSISEEDRSKTLDTSRKLGFEVGYYRHSEIGWVQEKLNLINRFAELYGFKDLIREQYDIGKQEGSRARLRDTKSGFSREEISKESDKESVSSMDRTKKDHFPSNIRSGYKRFDFEFSSPLDSITSPGLVDLPENVELPKTIERPPFFNGYKQLNPKKK